MPDHCTCCCKDSTDLARARRLDVFNATELALHLNVGTGRAAWLIDTWERQGLVVVQRPVTRNYGRVYRWASRPLPVKT